MTHASNEHPMSRGDAAAGSSATADGARTQPWYPYASYAEYHAARAAVADVIGWAEVGTALETARRIGEARYTVTSLYQPSREVVVRCDGGRPSVAGALCGTCGDAPAGPDGNCIACRGEWAIRNLPDVAPMSCEYECAGEHIRGCEYA